MQVYRTPILTLDPNAQAGGGMVEVVKLADAQATVEAVQRVRDEFEFERDQLHAALMEAKAALDAEREKVKTLEEQLRLANCDQANTEADLNDVTAQLATLQAQLRQVEGERDHAKKMEAVQKEVADNQTWHVRQLRQLVEVHTKQLTELTIIPIGCSREQELRWTQSIKDLRAVLAAQDAGKAVSSG